MSVRVSEREEIFFYKGSKCCELNSATDFQKNYCFYFEKHLKLPRRIVELYI